MIRALFAWWRDFWAALDQAGPIAEPLDQPDAAEAAGSSFAWIARSQEAETLADLRRVRDANRAYDEAKEQERKDEAERELRDAMRRYGLTERDRVHNAGRES